MSTFKFTVKEHEEYGSLGFAPNWYPDGDPLGGMAVAHDILEHFKKDEGGAEGEFMALGACIAIRGETGYFSRRPYGNGDIVDNISSDFPAIMYATLNQRGNLAMRKPQANPRIKNEIGELAREILSKGMKEFEDPTYSLTGEDRENIVKWVVLGYNKAKQRYKKYDMYTLMESIFVKIEEESDKLLKYAEEGMELVVKVDFKNMVVEMHCDYPGLWDY